MRRQSFNSKVIAVLKNPGAALKRIVINAVKKALSPVIIKVLLIVIPIFVVFSLFIPFGSASVASVRIFFASDSSLTKASEYYSKLAFDFNQNILNIPSNWKNQLDALGIDTSAYTTIPINYYWNTTPCTGDLTYDYDPFKLWAFVTAYYCDFDVPEGQEPERWEYDNDVENLIKRLFETEYEFKHIYQDVPTPPDTSPPVTTAATSSETNTSTTETTAPPPPEKELYYTVNRKMSFENAIFSILQSNEKIEYYRILSGTLSENPGETAFNIYGGHQTLKSPFISDLPTLMSINAGGKLGRIYHINGCDMGAWNYSHCTGIPGGFHTGTDIAASAGEPIYASANGIITNVGASDFEIYADSLPVYDSDTETYEAYIKYGNVRILPGISDGSAVTAGQQIAMVTSDRYCGDIGIGNYLHFSVSTNQNGSDVNIDPLLLIE